MQIIDKTGRWETNHSRISGAQRPRNEARPCDVFNTLEDEDSESSGPIDATYLAPSPIDSAQHTSAMPGARSLVVAADASRHQEIPESPIRASSS